MSERHRSTVRSIITRGQGACIVCGLHININNLDDLNNTIIAVVDREKPRRVSNLGLRHSLCQRSHYRPSLSPDSLEALVEAMVASTYKICPICKTSWVGCEFEELVLGLHGTKKNVLHLKCV